MSIPEVERNHVWYEQSFFYIFDKIETSFILIF